MSSLQEYQDFIVNAAGYNKALAPDKTKQVLLYIAGLVEELGESMDVVEDVIEFDNFDKPQQQLLSKLNRLHMIAGYCGDLKRQFREDDEPYYGNVISINPDDEETEHLTKELGDVLAYLTLLAHCFDISLEDIIQANRKKIEKRMAEGTMKGKGDDR